MKDLSQLASTPLGDILWQHSCHADHQRMRVHIGSIIQARSVATGDQLTRVESGLYATGLAFSKEQESHFARLQIQFNNSLPQGRPQLPLLHLTPRLLLLDEHQSSLVETALATYKDGILSELIAAEEATVALARRGKDNPGHSTQPKLAKDAKQTPMSPPSASSSTTPSHSSIKHNDKRVSDSVVDIVSAFSIKNSYNDDEESSDGWLTVGPGSTYVPVIPSIAHLPTTSAVEEIEQFPPLPPSPERLEMTEELVEAVEQAVSETILPLSQSIPSSISINQEAMVSKKKYDEDLREQRIFFEDQLQVLHLRLHVLQTKLDNLTEP